MDDLSDLIAIIQAKRLTLKQHQSDIDERLIRWGIRAVTQDGVSIPWAVLCENRPLTGQWWIVRAFLSERRLLQLNAHLDTVLSNDFSEKKL